MVSAAQNYMQLVQQLAGEFDSRLPPCVVVETVSRTDENLEPDDSPAGVDRLETVSRERLRFLDTAAAWTI